MKRRSDCPTNYGLEHFGDKWSLLIIRDLMFKGKRHYNEFLEADEKVSTSVLRDRLRSLEAGGLIRSGEDVVKKSRIRYSLTPKGIALLPLMVEMIIWSGQFDADSTVDSAFLNRAVSDRSGLIREIERELKLAHL
ncbi:MAG: helix-turn-helix transcriptional regulator [Roseivirga sp.]|nr:helix-turn-helix transcriptional regulator [Roseivirga sp.]